MTSPARMLKLPTVMERTGLSRSGIYRAVANENFPAPYKLEPEGRAVAWLESEVEAWILERPRSLSIHIPSASRGARG